MPTPPISDDLAREAVESIEAAGWCVSVAARRMGLSPSALRNRYAHAEARGLVEPGRLQAEFAKARRARSAARAEPSAQPGVGGGNAPREQHVHDDEQADKGQRVLDSNTERIQTPEQLLAKADVNMAEWRVERQVVNQWEGLAKVKRPDPDRPDEPEAFVEAVEVTVLYQVKVWLRRRDPFDPEAVRDLVVGAMAEHAPTYAPPPWAKRRTPRRSPWLLEVSVPDLHVGKLAWVDEVGEAYDAKRAASVHDMAVDHFIGHAERMVGREGFARVLHVVGNDLLHVDNPDNTTTAGTRQDVDGRWQKGYRVAMATTVRAIDRLAGLAPMRVVVVPGNHDRQATFMLGETLAAWYRTARAVEVVNEPRPRPLVKWGRVLLMLAHGDEEKPSAWPMLLVNRDPEAYAQAVHREVQLGHWHTSKETRYVAGDTHDGVVVRILPSLSGTDRWHYGRGYVHGPKAAKAMLWHREHGLVAEYTWTPPPGVYR